MDKQVIVDAFKDIKQAADNEDAEALIEAFAGLVGVAFACVAKATEQLEEINNKLGQLVDIENGRQVYGSSSIGPVS